MTMTDAPTTVPSEPPSGPEAQLELWRNGGRGRVLVNRFGADGKIRAELIGAGKSFHLTPAERRYNQELAALPKLDVFTNGTLQPVRLLDGEPDTQTLLDNPNHIPEDDARKVFRMTDQQFKARLETITNEAALQRLFDLANDRQTRATVWQLRAIEARLASVAPAPDHIRPEAASAGSDRPAEPSGSGGRGPKAVSPR